MPRSRVVLVTGASSGMGRAIASLAARRGFTVFGASRSAPALEPASGVKMLPLDVREDESVRACLDAVLRESGRLDVLVNNAGYALRGAAEETSLEEARAEFETNFWGVVRMVKAALPLMRRQGSGQIVNISSLAGVVGVPFGAFYSASKFALEGYSESLRHEVKPFGIHVSLVEPSFIKTNFYQNWQLAAGLIDDYAQVRGWIQMGTDRRAADAVGPAVVAECVLRILEARAPRLRYQVGKEAGRSFRLSRTLPETLVARITRRKFNVDGRDQPERQGTRPGLQP